MNIEEVQTWKAFKHPDGTVRDLSFFNAHEVLYTHKAIAKPDKNYNFLVTYSFHCFCKQYEYQSDKEKDALMYFSPREQRPFCDIRYSLGKQFLRDIIESLGVRKVMHAGYGSYAVVAVELPDGATVYYFVVFKVFRERKKFRIHVTSAYPVTEKPNGHLVSFFTIACNVVSGKKLPRPPK